MAKPTFRVPIALLATLALVACSRGAEHSNPDRDPVAAAALNDPIMADPDLAAQNRGNAALTGGGPASAEIPGYKNTPEEADAGRDAAEDLLGGPIATAPAPGQTIDQSRLASAATVLATAERSGLGSPACLMLFGFSAGWAARLPAALPVYPRGHTTTAGGADSAACKLRSVRFVTPVGVASVIDFYFASASRAKLPVERRREGGDEVVAGRRAGAGFAVYARKRGDGLTEVDLITSGL